MNQDSALKAKPDAPSGDGTNDRPVQTGALSGGQPGQGVDRSASPRGQSNVDASVEQGTEYGNRHRDPR